MKKKKWVLTMGMLLGMGLLTACSQATGQGQTTGTTSQQATSVETTTTTTTSQETSQQETSTESKKEHYSWDGVKAGKLRRYMINEWGPSQERSYKRVTEETPANYYGLSLPEDLIGGDAAMQVFLGEKKVVLGYSEDGDVSAGALPVVDMYTDIESSPFSGRLYLFVISDGKPTVWVTEQNQGTGDNSIYFQETSDKKLLKTFSRLAQE